MESVWERKKRLAAEEAKKRKVVRAVTGTIAQTGLDLTKAAAGFKFGSDPAAISAAIINIVGTVSLVAWQYLKAKKEQKIRARKDKHQQMSQTAVDTSLDSILQIGLIAIKEHGIDPTTSEFEKVLYDNLFKTIGYRGNCNIAARSGHMFSVTKNGRIFTGHGMFTAPPNIQTYWRIQCRNMRDLWVETYRNMLIEQGRTEELDMFQSAQKKGVLALRVGFGIIFSMLMFFAIKYGTQIK